MKENIGFPRQEFADRSVPKRPDIFNILPGTIIMNPRPEEVEMVRDNPEFEITCKGTAIHKLRINNSFVKE